MTEITTTTETAEEFQADLQGVIVTLEPSMADREALAVPGGEPPERLHMTLAHLGNIDSAPNPGDVLPIIMATAMEYAPMQGSVGGIGHFGAAGSNTVALVDLVGVAEFRTELVEALVEAGVFVDMTHDFIPHITLAYDMEVPDASSKVGTPLSFEKIGVRFGPQVVYVPLMGQETEGAPEAPEMEEPTEAPAEVPTEEAPTEEPSMEEAPVAYEIQTESEECAAGSDGALTIAVVAVDGEEREIESCWATEEEAQARIEVLMAEDAGDEADDMLEEAPVEEAPVVATAAVKVEVAGIGELERAAALAAEVRETLDRLAALAPQAREAVEAALTDIDIEFTAIMSHETGFSDDPWDGPANEVNVRSPEEESYFANVYAWRDDEADTSVKANYRFIHHFVSEDGRAGAASTVACSTGIGVLNGGMGGTTIPTADRQGVYDHLARHLRDADREPPELMSVEDSMLVAAAVDNGFEIDLADPSTFVDALEFGRLLNEEAVIESGEPLVMAEETTDEVDADPLTAVPDDLLIAELARRWAEDTAAKLETAGADPDDASTTEDATAEVAAEEGAEMAGDTIEAADVDGDGVEDAPVEHHPQAMPPTQYEWEGVLIVEGLPSGDGRMVNEGALTWRELPIPLMLQTVNAPGHDGAVICGSIHEIERQGQNIIGRGNFDSGEAGVEAKRLLSEGTMRGVSADIDSVVVEFVSPDGSPVDFEEMLFEGVEALECLVEGRIMGATLTPFPAFQEAQVKVLGSDDQGDDFVLVASGAEVIGDVWRVPSPIGMRLAGDLDAENDLAALVASAAEAVEVPASPPREWFMPGEMAEPVPFTVHPDGRCYGLIAQWGTCHIGFTDRCVPVPKSGCAYKHFRNKSVLTAEGELVATGPIIMDTVHPELRMRASDAQAFYADTGCAVADVAIYENEWGIVAAGAMRPGLSPEQARRFRGSDVSPDWRSIKGRLEVVGLLCVNVSGFIVQGLVASGAEVPNPRGLFDSTSGEVTALVAAGMVRHADTEANDLRREMDAMRAEIDTILEAIRPMRAERAAARVVNMALSLGDQTDEQATEDTTEAAEHRCSCGGAIAEASTGVCACAIR